MTRHLALALFSLFVKARITVELTWNTEKLSNTCCQSKNQLLMWNFTEGVNETITELQWFFNETTLICLDSKTIGFHVETVYDGRIERNGTAGILLKNVSLNDAGKYTLYVKLAEEKIRNIQQISLTVDEQIPDQCKPIIEIHSQNVMYCSTTCFERSQLSPEWIINGTRDTVGIGRRLIIYAGINEQALCCLRGLKCHDDDQFKFCMPNSIISKVFTSKEDIHTRRHNESNTVKVTNSENNNTSNVLIILGVLQAASLLFVIITVGCFMLRRHKSHHRVVTPMYKRRTQPVQRKTNGRALPVLNRSLHDSNSHENIQIVNNISMDADILKYIADFQRPLMMELESVIEETRILKRLLTSYKIDKSVEMTEVKCHCHNHNDTDTHSDFEDAVSEPAYHVVTLDQIQL